MRAVSKMFADGNGIQPENLGEDIIKHKNDVLAELYKPDSLEPYYAC